MLRSSLFVLISFVLSISCKVGYEKLTTRPEPYFGDEIKTNGYYYCIDTVKSGLKDKPRIDIIARVYFFYRNGVVHSSNTIFSGFQDLETLFKDNSYMSRYKEFPYGWGIYSVENEKIKIEGWSTSTGGKHPKFKYNLDIIQDNILYYSFDNNKYNFKDFEPKPDSVNRFIN